MSSPRARDAGSARTTGVLPASAAAGRILSWRTGLVLVIAIALFRVPLWLTPGAGRDEATYHYWSHHFEPAFAPLVQGTIRVFEGFGGCSLWALRGPVLVLGLLALYLNDRRLAVAGATVSSRRLALVALAVSAWQSFAGSILHPDAFLLVALLAWALAVEHDRTRLSAVAAWAAVLAKPTGVLLLPVAWWMIGRIEGRSTDPSQRRDWIARGLLVLAFLGFALPMTATMLGGMADFGRMPSSTPLLSRLAAGLLALVFLGGPLFLVLPIVGSRERLAYLRGAERPRTGRRRPDPVGPELEARRTRREAEACLAAAAVLLGFFLAAAILRGQFKGNWILPALLLVWPLRLPDWPRGVLVAGVALTAFASALQAVAFLDPDLIGRAEERWLNTKSPNYEVHSGVREARVSTSRSWRDHLAEFGDASEFASAIEAGWEDTVVPFRPIRWVVSDDYGLAAQLHWNLHRPDVAIVIPGDAVFRRTLPPFLGAEDPGPALVLIGGGRSDQIWDRIVIRGSLPTVPHPVTGRAITPRLGERAASREAP